MQNQLGNQAAGYLKVKIEGPSLERFLNLCKYRGIEVWELKAIDGAFVMYMRADGFKKLKPILKKTRTRIRIIERYGVPFFLHKYRKRKLFFAGFFFCIGLIRLFSGLVWSIEMEGNYAITEQVLLEYLGTLEVTHGMRISKVSCEEIEAGIRKEFEEVIWASASLKGCRLIVSVRENTDTISTAAKEEIPGDIIASSDGVITYMITRSGVPAVTVGEEVKKDDLLISGLVEIAGDGGEVIREDYVASDGDIYANVLLSYEDFCQAEYAVKVYSKSAHKELFFKISNYFVSAGFGNGNKLDQEITTREQCFKIGKSFSLPISVGIYEEASYTWEEAAYSLEEMRAQLEENLDRYKAALEEEGCQVLEENLKTYEESKGLKITGSIKVLKAIGIFKQVDL